MSTSMRSNRPRSPSRCGSPCRSRGRFLERRDMCREMRRSFGSKVADAHRALFLKRGPRYNALVSVARGRFMQQKRMPAHDSCLKSMRERESSWQSANTSARARALASILWTNP